MTNDVITIFSTHAQDILVDESGKILSRQEGGPILFLEQALNNLKVPFYARSGEKVTVNILINKKGEFGTIPTNPIIVKAKEDKFSSWVIISTLLNEWDISNLVKNPQLKLFVDLQGYVRNGKNLGRKHLWEELVFFHNSIYCIKGTKEEICYIPPKILESQKSRMLLVTKGPNDLDLYYKNHHYSIPVKSIRKPKDTIGAGDSFFGYYVGHLFLGKGPKEAAVEAVKATTNFLKEK